MAPAFAAALLASASWSAVAWAQNLEKTFPSYIAKKPIVPSPSDDSDYVPVQRGSTIVRVPGNRFLMTDDAQTVIDKLIDCSVNECLNFPDYTVASNAELKLTAGTAGTRLTRLGFTTPGDGGRADYDWSAVNCTAEDDGAQVQPTMTGCWIADFSGMRPTPMIWGAAGNGTTDDTVKVQAAITAMANKTLWMGPHRYCIGEPGLVSYQPIIIYGEGLSGQYDLAGAKYGLQACSPNLEILTFGNNGTTAANGSVVHNLLIEAGVGATINTSGAGIVNDGVSWVHLSHVRVNRACIGIDEKSGNNNRVDHSNIWTPTHVTGECGGIRVGQNSTLAGTVDYKVIDTTIEHVGPIGILVKDAGGMFIRGVDTLYAGNGLVVKPGLNQQVLWMFAESSALSDNTCYTGLVVDTDDASAIVSGLSFNQTWTSTAGSPLLWGAVCEGPGAELKNTAGGLVKNIRFIGHRAFRNHYEGIVIRSGVSEVAIDSSDICGNSAVTLVSPGTITDGIKVDVGASDIAIRNNRIGANCAWNSSNVQGTGIYLWGSNNNIIITGNDLGGNTAASLSYAPGLPPSGAVVINNNLDVDNIIPSVAAATSIELPIGTNIAITGGAAISAISGTWEGRTVNLNITGAGTSFVASPSVCNSKSVAQFEQVVAHRMPGTACVYIK